MRWLGLGSFILCVLIFFKIENLQIPPAPPEKVEKEKLLTPFENTGIDLTGQELSITVIIHENETVLREALIQYTIKKNPSVSPVIIRADIMKWKIFGFAEIDKLDEKKCVIHVVKPLSQEDRERFNTWGHELLHCTYGLFHKN